MLYFVHCTQYRSKDPNYFKSEVVGIYKIRFVRPNLANPFFPLGGLRPLAANSFTCFSMASSSARAARLKIAS